LSIVGGILYVSIPRGDTPDVIASIGLIICGGVKSFEFFFFFLDFLEFGVPPGVEIAGLRDTSILSADTAPPSSVPLRYRQKKTSWSKKTHIKSTYMSS
jgi:hypothetical protein